MIRKLALAFALVPTVICAQLNVTPNSTATSLAQVITGNGVSVSNANLNCGGSASGTFTYTGTNLGMTGGIILTTGSATDPANAQNYFCNVQNGNFVTDPDLTTVEPNATNDVCLLEFDFVPICSNINITFVFGSEEYPTFVNSFNDGFGIFLTGPNPGGGNYTAQNIGVLPNNTPVSINNVNGSVNSSYFVANYNLNYPDIAYGGYTIPVTSTTPVYPCSTYHMKIAIGDALDEAYDSGVFIGNNAVSCTNAPSVTASSAPASCGGNNGSVTATVTNYTGTVTYQWLPGNQTTSSVNNLPAGNYTCVVTYTAGCSSSTSQTVITTVGNTGSNLTLATTTQSVTCPNGTNGSATVNPSGGTSPYTYNWNTTPPQSTATASNLSPGIYQVTINDNSGCVGTTTVNIGVAYPTILQTVGTSTCGTIETFTAPAGTNYQWYNPSNSAIPGATSSSYNASGFAGGQYFTVGFTDNTTGCRDSIRYTITQQSLNFSANSSPACTGGATGGLSFSGGLGGSPAPTYSWSVNGVTNAGTSASPINVSGLSSGNYTVSIYLDNNSTCVYTYTGTVGSAGVIPVSIDTVRACNGDTVHLNPNLPNSTYNWYTGNGTSIGSSASTVALDLFPKPYSGLNVNTAGAAYIDTIRSSAGCKSVYKAVIKQMSFTPQPSTLLQLKCHNDSTGKLKVTIVRENNGPINQPYQINWVYPSPYASPGTITVNSAPPITSTEANLHPGQYYCIISAGNCIDTVSYFLQNPAAPPTGTMSAYYCPQDSLALIVAEPGHSSYHWLSNGAAVTSLTNDSVYVTTVDINNYSVWYLVGGCHDTAKARVDYPVYDAFRPEITVNIFTPNADNRNDFFFPFYDARFNYYQIEKQMESYELKIYNRWGKLMYETTRYAAGWNGFDMTGNKADDGTYFWITKYKSNCSSKADIVEKQGYVQLLR